MLIRWSDRYSVNVKAIDLQHQRLVNLVNDLHEAMKSGTSDAAKGQVLSALVNYTRTHFATEEQLLSTHGYPDLTRHKAEHDTLTKQVLDIQTQFREGQTVLTVGLMNFLRDWLTNHILGTDKQYSAFLNQRGVA